MAKLTSKVASLTGQAEAQRLYPALQQLLASWCSTCKTGDAALQSNTCSCIATSSLQETSTACNTRDADSSVSSQRMNHLAAAQAPIQPHLHHLASKQHPSQYRSSSSRAGVAALDDGNSSSSSSSSSGNDASKQGGPSHSSRGHSSSSSGPGVQFDPLSEALYALHSATGTQLTPSAIVQKLDKHIVGQPDAKRAVAVALRNRWRRHMLPNDLAEEITPKNILMIGPTGCGKTEIARRLAQLVQSPFIKVEATKFTELGFVGRDVDEIVKDLMEASLALTRNRLSEALREVADRAAENIILTALTGPGSEDGFRQLYRQGRLDDQMVDLDLDALGVNNQMGGGMGTQGNPLQAFAAMMEAMAGRAGGRAGARARQPGKGNMTVAEARKLLIDNDIERSLSSDRVVQEAVRAAQQDGIVFIDEIDKIVETSRGVSGATSSNVSSEGVQRDLLPILEGSVVPTKYGNVSTEHVLFIASGAFHSSKPSDMLAELQGRLPVRVELAGLTADDFYRILTEPKHNMIKQQQVLLATEGVDLVFSDGAVRAIAEAAHQANRLLDNIGARRLHTVVERVLADISFSAPEKVAEAQRQKQQESAPADSTAGASSSKGSKDKAAGSKTSSKSGKAKGSSSKESSSTSSSTSDSSRTEGLLRYEVTEEMVNACMKELLKQKDLSRYML